MDTEYFGKGLDLKSCEIKGMRIDPTHRDGEADLIQSRWFDYATLHPTQATYLYASIYKRQTLEFHKSFIDIETADKARAFSPDDIFMSRDLTSMWLARRSADALGVPYPFVMRFAQQRALERTFKHLQRPNQLYGEEFEVDLAALWAETLATRLTYSRLPMFHGREGKRSVIQKRHEIFVVGQIKKRPLPHDNLLARMMKEGILTSRAAHEHFAEDVVERAQSIACNLG
jgi:hypothetical protein